MLEILKAIGKSLLSALLTEAFIKEIILFFAEKLVEKTDNTLDNELFDKLKKALDKKKES